MGNLSKENPEHLCGLRPTWREPNVTTTGTYGKRVVFNEACVKGNLQKHNFNIEIIKNYLKLNKLPSRTMPISKCKLLITPKYNKGPLLNAHQQQSLER